MPMCCTERRQAAKKCEAKGRQQLAAMVWAVVGWLAAAVPFAGVFFTVVAFGRDTVNRLPTTEKAAASTPKRGYF